MFQNPKHNLCKQANKISSRASAFFLGWFLTTALQKWGLRLGCHRRGENERGYVVLPETHVIRDLILVEAWTDILEIGMTRGTGGERFSTWKLEAILYILIILLMVQKSGLHQLRLVVYPIIYRVSYIPGGAGFLPSTVGSMGPTIYLPTLMVDFYGKW